MQLFEGISFNSAIALIGTVIATMMGIIGMLKVLSAQKMVSTTQHESHIKELGEDKKKIHEALHDLEMIIHAASTEIKILHEKNENLHEISRAQEKRHKQMVISLEKQINNLNDLIIQMLSNI